MKIGFVGLGKLGMPCAVGMSMMGHDVLGYDINPDNMSKEPRHYLETGPDGISDFNKFLRRSEIRFGSLREVAEHSEIIFIAVQTPHDPAFEGTTRLTNEKKDFDYTFLQTAVTDLANVIQRKTIVVVISTVLPGTIRSIVMPRKNQHMQLCYNPYFIAMGNTMNDFFNPEFVLCGSDDHEAAETLHEFYRSIHTGRFVSTTIENAELIKVGYNTFIGLKISFANTMMEICHKVENTDVDVVTHALSMATNRIISPKYMSGGMGDGGGCHPRDNIALSWLSEKLDLSYNLFDALMRCREAQTEWLADLMESYPLPKAILGYSYKPESNITVGSPALLLKNILIERGHDVFMHDPVVESAGKDLASGPARVYLVGSKHPVFQDYKFAPGSIVLDPWRYLSSTDDGVTIVPIGNHKFKAPSTLEQFLSHP